MDIQDGVDFVQRWIELSYELHSASAEWSDALKTRIASELDPMFLDEADWTGDAPFTRFENKLSPGPSTFVGAEQLAKRILFKGEQWSAPDAGGIVRIFVSDDQTGWTTRPKVVLDVALVDGQPRVIAMHAPCPRCMTTTIDKHGEQCAYVSRSGKACLDGVMFGGGVAFSRGELLGSTKVNDPAPKWAPMMAR